MKVEPAVIQAYQQPGFNEIFINRVVKRSSWELSDISGQISKHVVGPAVSVSLHFGKIQPTIPLVTLRGLPVAPLLVLTASSTRELCHQIQFIVIYHWAPGGALIYLGR
jgi:hypothetical protein